MNASLLSFGSPDELANAAAMAWLEVMGKDLRETKAHYVALSGGRIVRSFFAAVSRKVRAENISIAGARFFWADERCVPPADPQSNFLLAQQTLFEPLKIPPQQIHRIQGEYSPAEAAALAQAEIRQVVPAHADGQPQLDLVLLGLGEDGHIASLFPGESGRKEAANDTYCAVIHSPKPPPQRVTLSYAAIAAARRTWVVASGRGKGEALRASLVPGGTTPLAHLLALRPDTQIYSDIVTVN